MSHLQLLPSRRIGRNRHRIRPDRRRHLGRDHHRRAGPRHQAERHVHQHQHGPQANPPTLPRPRIGEKRLRTARSRLRRPRAANRSATTPRLWSCSRGRADSRADRSGLDHAGRRNQVAAVSGADGLRGLERPAHHDDLQPRLADPGREASSCSPSGPACRSPISACMSAAAARGAGRDFHVLCPRLDRRRRRQARGRDRALARLRSAAQLSAPSRRCSAAF